VTHYAIDHGTTERLQSEILTAKKDIESHTGQPVDVFTYPYGAYNNNAIALLQQDGFIGAISTLPGKTNCKSDLMTIKRTRIGNAPLYEYGI
jgi:peptidoglycan/xylan/chitin deacetylase (PgdA/CDA1 family)